MYSLDITVQNDTHSAIFLNSMNRPFLMSKGPVCIGCFGSNFPMLRRLSHHASAKQVTRTFLTRNMELLKYLLVALLWLISGILTDENINTEDRHEDLPPLFQDVSIIFSPKKNVFKGFFIHFHSLMLLYQIYILLKMGFSRS